MKIGMICSQIIGTAALLILIASPQSATSEWTPKRIVGMDYPRIALLAQVEGEIEVNCELNPDGSVHSAKPFGQAKPHPLLLKAVQENAGLWIFMRSSEGIPKTNTIVLKYSFKLQGGPSDHPRSQFIFDYPNKVSVTSERSTILG